MKYSIFLALCSISLGLFAQNTGERFLGGANFDIGRKLVYNSDGSYIIAAEVASADGLGEGHSGDDLSADVVVAKYSPQGLAYWKVMLDGDGHEDIGDMIATSDGGFAVIGTTNSKKGTVRSTHGEMDIFVAKISAAGDLKWTRNYGGIGNDRGFGITEVFDGGFILACEAGSLDGNMRSEPRGGLDAWVARTDYTGEIMWEKHIGGTRNDNALNVITLGENSFIVVGTTNSEDRDVKGKAGQHDAWIYELDADGKMIWQTKYGGEYNEMVHATRLDKDGNIVIAGTTFSKTGIIQKQRGLGDMWLLKIDKKGKMIFSKTYGGAQQDGASDVLCTKDGGYLLVGVTQSKDGDFTEPKGYYDGGVIKTDKNGAVQWSKTLGSAKKDFLHTAIEYPDGSGYLCMGLSEEDDKNPAHLMYHHGKYDIWITTVTEPNKQIVVKKNYNPMIEGIVKDKKSGRPVKTSLSLIDFYDQDSIESVATNPDNGEYMMLAPIDSRVGKRVSLIAAPLGFFPSSSDILTDSLITIPVWRVNFKLSPLSINERALVPNLVFEQNQTKPNANAGLTALELFMQSNETVKIELNGYATSDENNAVSLSQQRADFVKNYLIQKGINPARVTSKGKGATNSPNLGHGIEMNILAL